MRVYNHTLQLGALQQPTAIVENSEKCLAENHQQSQVNEDVQGKNPHNLYDADITTLAK